MRLWTIFAGAGVATAGLCVALWAAPGKGAPPPTKVPRQLSIIDKPNGECIFLEGVNTCTIQAVKPAHCKGFPNAWNFPGWREICEAVPVELPDEAPAEKA